MSSLRCRLDRYLNSCQVGMWRVGEGLPVISWTVYQWKHGMLTGMLSFSKLISLPFEGRVRLFPRMEWGSLCSFHHCLLWLLLTGVSVPSELWCVSSLFPRKDDSTHSLFGRVAPSERLSNWEWCFPYEHYKFKSLVFIWPVIHLWAAGTIYAVLLPAK